MRSKHSWDFVCICVWSCVYVYAVCICVWPCVYVYGRVYMCRTVCICVWPGVYMYMCILIFGFYGSHLTTGKQFNDKHNPVQRNRDHMHRVGPNFCPSFESHFENNCFKREIELLACVLLGRCVPF